MTDAAIAHVVTGLVTITTMVIGFLTLWIKLKYGVGKAEEAATKAGEVERKIDHNTTVTTETLEKTEVVADKLNGKLEEKINTIVRCHTEPITAIIEAHTQQDDKNMAEIRVALGELRDRTNK